MADKKFQKAAKAFIEDKEVIAGICYCRTKDGVMRAAKGELENIAYIIGIGIATASMQTGFPLDELLNIIGDVAKEAEQYELMRGLNVN